MHHMKCKSKGLRGGMAPKLDITKAYDRISRDFFHAIMIKLDFDDKWVNGMMMCVRSVKYLS